MPYLATLPLAALHFWLDALILAMFLSLPDLDYGAPERGRAMVHDSTGPIECLLVLFTPFLPFSMSSLLSSCALPLLPRRHFPVT